MAIDTGGTFTDVAVRCPDGAVFVWKVPSRPDAPGEAVVHGLTEALAELGAGPADVARLMHGTTVATNTLLTRTGARVGLVTTDGFRDVLRIGHQTRPSIYELQARRPAPLVPRNRIWEVSERLAGDGTVLQELPEDAVWRLAEDIRASGSEVVVVSFLNAYANPAHEQRCVDLLAQAGAAPHVFAATSVIPEVREYERTSTAVLNAYVAPAIGGYLRRLEQRLTDGGLATRLWIMQSSGGLLGANAAAEQSVRTILSGLAGGVMGAARWSSQLGLPNVVSLDIGGTSTDIALIRDGRPAEMASGEIEGYGLRLPAVDVHTIGAGGGSVAWLDSGSGLRVGPHSAGAAPGPVCYGQGGTDLTVTDAHLLLGRLGKSLLDGRVPLDEQASRKQLHTFAGELGMDSDEAAAGIVRVANAAMARGIRKVSVERGVDVRQCVLTAFGGAGPLHAASLVRELGMKGAVVPPHPGIASAMGMLDAPVRHDFAANVARPGGGHDDASRAASALSELADRATRFMEGEEKVPTEAIAIERSVDVRYLGQSYELTIPWDGGHRIRSRFDAAHEQRYGYADRDADMELVTARVTVTAPLTSGNKPPTLDAGEPPPPVARRPLFSDGDWRDVSVYRREHIPSGCVLHGPLVIEQLDTTIVVLSDQICGHDDRGFLHIRAAETA